MGEKFKYRPKEIDIEVSGPHTQQTGDEADAAHDEYSHEPADLINDNREDDMLDKANTFVAKLRKSGRFHELEAMMRAKKGGTVDLKRIRDDANKIKKKNFGDE